MTEAVAVPALVVSLVVALVGFLLNRSIAAVDLALAKVSAKVDGLGEKGGLLSEGQVALKVRVDVLERSHDRLDRVTAGLMRSLGEPPP